MGLNAECFVTLYLVYFMLFTHINRNTQNTEHEKCKSVVMKMHNMIMYIYEYDKTWKTCKGIADKSL